MTAFCCRLAAGAMAFVAQLTESVTTCQAVPVATPEEASFCCADKPPIFSGEGATWKMTSEGSWQRQWCAILDNGILDLGGPPATDMAVCKSDLGGVITACGYGYTHTLDIAPVQNSQSAVVKIPLVEPA